MRCSFKEMCRAVGVKKPEEAPKARALWKMKAAKDAGEEYYDPTREDNIQGRSETRSALWEEHLKDPIVALDKALKCVEIFLDFSARVLGGRVSRNGGRWLPPKFVGKADLGGRFCPTWIRWIVCVCAQSPRNGMQQGSVGRMASSLSS